jgi:hypothetical protein
MRAAGVFLAGPVEHDCFLIRTDQARLSALEASRGRPPLNLLPLRETTNCGD